MNEFVALLAAPWYWRTGFIVAGALLSFIITEKVYRRHRARHPKPMKHGMSTSDIRRMRNGQ